MIGLQKMPAIIIINKISRPKKKSIIKNTQLPLLVCGYLAERGKTKLNVLHLFIEGRSGSSSFTPDVQRN